MKIVPIFASRIYAVKYAGGLLNSYDEVMGLWNDVSYLASFLAENAGDIPEGLSRRQVLSEILEDVGCLENLLVSSAGNVSEDLDSFFRPLYDQEYRFRILSRRKGRFRCIRLYALKIDEGLYVVTGGAIKLPLQHTMQEREHTRVELQKLGAVQHYLRREGVFDDSSFFELVA